MHCPGVNIFDRIIFVDEKDAIAVFLEQPRKKCLVHARAERAFEIVIVDDRYFGIFVAPCRTSGDVDLLHDRGVGIAGQIELRHTEQSLVVTGKQKFEVLLFVGTDEGDRQRVIVGKLTRPERSHNHFYVGWERILRPNVPFDHTHDVEGSGRSCRS
jgi:hypothetical protein